MTRVLFSAKADRALMDALRHIAQDKPVAAVDLIVDLQERLVQTLSTFPEAGAKWQDDRRALTIRRDAFVYRFDAVRDEVVVMNVYGPGMDWR
jgi:plasmid stabilization system protein ParE